MNEVTAGRFQALGKLSTLCHIPAAFNPVRGRQTQPQHAVKGLAHCGKNLQRIADPVLEVAAVVVAALIGQRRQELVQQITVRIVNFDCFDAHTLGALGCCDKCIADLRHLF